jgi:hypothetical protein
MKLRTFGALVTLVVLLNGCATVDVTKTAKGFYSPTKADDVDILMTRPAQDYIELATVSTTNWSPSETAKMHNAIRAKTAPLGANAVVLTESGILRGNGRNTMWTTGVALRFKSEKAGEDTQP